MREQGYRMIRYADDFVVLCASAEQAEQALQKVSQWTAQAGLTLHPEKTRLVDLSIDQNHIDFLGYRFTRRMNKIIRGIKPKKFSAIRAKIKAMTPRNNKHSTALIVERLNSTLRGVFEYFKHVTLIRRRNRNTTTSDLELLDSRVRSRLRRMLAVREKRCQTGRGPQACRRWSNAYFTKLGLFSMQNALTAMFRSQRGNT
jgi:RNA-directed DNA polymerase